MPKTKFKGTSFNFGANVKPKRAKGKKAKSKSGKVSGRSFGS